MFRDTPGACPLGFAKPRDSRYIRTMACGKAFWVFVAALVLGACATGDVASDAGAGSTALDAGAGSVDPDAAAPMECDVTAPTRCPEPPPRYADVEPIFQQRCVGCHYGMPDGPWPLTSYGHVASWANEIRGQVLACTMPPPEEGVPMTVEEREAILTWIRCGVPE